MSSCVSVSLSSHLYPIPMGDKWISSDRLRRRFRHVGSRQILGPSDSTRGVSGAQVGSPDTAARAPLTFPVTAQVERGFPEAAAHNATPSLRRPLVAALYPLSA
jgi:hypothetical protein